MKDEGKKKPKVKGLKILVYLVKNDKISTVI